MAKEKKASKQKPVSGKKKILKTVTDQLNSSLTTLKGQLGEKKFKKRVKKAAKKLVAGIKAPVKKAGKAKKAVLLKPKPALKKPE
jgi:hypothetical protein